MSDTGKPNFRAASCCSVEVVNGGAGMRFCGCTVMSEILKSLPLQASRNSRALSAVGKRRFSSARKVLPLMLNSAVTRKFDSLLNFCISRSRSTMSFTATLCTRPAESDGFTLRHSTGESLKPTIRSSTRRACCASTRFMSMARGFFMALSMAGFVIS